MSEHLESILNCINKDQKKAENIIIDQNIYGCLEKLKKKIQSPQPDVI